jgi:hypothetical protein
MDHRRVDGQQNGSSEGRACTALHMAAACGYLDERQQRVVMRTLATTINPNVDFFQVAIAPCVTPAASMTGTAEISGVRLGVPRNFAARQSLR